MLPCWAWKKQVNPVNTLLALVLIEEHGPQSFPLAQPYPTSYVYGTCAQALPGIILKHNPQSLATHRLLDGSSTNAGDHASGHEGGAPQCPGPSRFRRYRHTPRSMGTDRLSSDLHA